MKKKISDFLAMQVMCNNDGDIASATTLLSVVKERRGYIVSMGVDDKCGLGLISDRYTPALYLINPQQFVAAAESSPSFLTPIDPKEQLPESTGKYLCIMEGPTEGGIDHWYDMRWFYTESGFKHGEDEHVHSWFNLPKIDVGF